MDVSFRRREMEIMSFAPFAVTIVRPPVINRL